MESLFRAGGGRGQPGPGLCGAVFVFRVQKFEHQRGKRGGGEITGEVNPQVRGFFDVHDRDAGGDRRIESAAGDAAEREGHDDHGETDGEAVIGIARRGLGGGDVENNITQGKGPDEFGDQCGHHLDFRRGHGRITLQIQHNIGSSERT